MQQYIKEITVSTNRQSLIEITQPVNAFCQHSNVNQGIINLSILHTSASLLIQENASPDVLNDLQNFFDKLVPMNKHLYTHVIEGEDDMPAHIKSALTQSHLTLTIHNHKLMLGTWQGIFVFEHRKHIQQRIIVAHIMGE